MEYFEHEYLEYNNNENEKHWLGWNRNDPVDIYCCQVQLMLIDMNIVTSLSTYI